MKRIIQFSRFFRAAFVIAIILTILGVVGYIHNDGFNLGIDFQAGLIQEIRIASTAFKLTWSGTTNATLSYDSNNIHMVVSGAGIESRTYTFPFSDYPSIGSLTQAMTYRLEGLNVELTARPSVSTGSLLFSTQGNPFLGETPFIVHYFDPNNAEVSIAEVRAAMDSFAYGVAVQTLGQPQDRHFMIRVEDREESGVRPDQVIRLLEAHFGQGEVVVLRSDYVGSRFAKNLTDQAGILIAMTLLVLLLYSTLRFKLQYAISLVIAIIFDAIVVVGFIAWSRMEFTTLTIAAILTIVGYSTNDTIVVFDRIRETRRTYPDASYLEVLNRSLTETLSRTIITTLSTMIAVLALFIFTTGAMKDFALALMVGMFTGVFTTTFIASAIVNFLEIQKVRQEKKKQALIAAAAVKK